MLSVWNKQTRIGPPSPDPTGPRPRVPNPPPPPYPPPTPNPPHPQPPPPPTPPPPLPPPKPPPSAWTNILDPVTLPMTTLPPLFLQSPLSSFPVLGPARAEAARASVYNYSSTTTKRQGICSVISGHTLPSWQAGHWHTDRRGVGSRLLGLGAWTRCQTVLILSSLAQNDGRSPLSIPPEWLAHQSRATMVRAHDLGLR